jgi:hypothetical protein
MYVEIAFDGNPIGGGGLLLPDWDQEMICQGSGKHPDVNNIHLETSGYNEIKGRTSSSLLKGLLRFMQILTLRMHAQSRDVGGEIVS